MAIVAESFDFVIGVDTHAKTHTLAVVTPDGLVGDTGRLSRFPLNFGSGRCDRQAAITGSS